MTDQELATRVEMKADSTDSRTAARNEAAPKLLEMLKEFVDIACEVRGIGDLADDDPDDCDDLCGDYWCYEFGCIALKFTTARKAIAKAEGR